MAIPRETLIEQSVTDHLRGHLEALGYTADKLIVRDAFPTVEERSSPLMVSTLAVGFSYDDGGRMAEMGSDLVHRIYTTEFWTFGTSSGLGENVSNIVKQIFEQHHVVPLLDYTKPLNPQFDALVMLEERGVQVQRQIATDPLPWDLNVYTTTLKFEDFYSASVPVPA
jgi:hypothetical protein